MIRSLLLRLVPRSPLDVKVADVAGVPAEVRYLFASRGLVWVSDLMRDADASPYAEKYRPAHIFWVWSGHEVAYTLCPDAEAALDKVVDQVVQAMKRGAA